MSLLWSNRLEVLLSAQGAAVISLTADSNNNKQKQKVVPAIKNSEVANWHSAITSLDGLLSAMQVKPNTQLTVVLSSDFIRYQLLPAQQVLMSSAEKIAYAAVAYKEIYGPEIDDWKIKLHETGFNQAIIAAAVDERFLAKIQQVSQQHQIKLISLQAYLMTAYNSANKQLSQLSGYFVVVEAETLILLNMQQGQCQKLRMSTVSNDWQQDLQQLLQRESMLNHSSSKDVLLHAPAHQRLIKIEGWHVSLAPKVPLQLKSNEVKSNSHSATLEVAV